MNTPSSRSFLSRVLIGRASQLEELHRLVALNDGPRTLIVSGEAGVGKSRLVSEARQFAAAVDSLVLQGTCFERDTALPYSAITDLLRSSLLLLPPPVGKPLLDLYGPELVKLVPEISAPHPSITPTESLDADQERRRIFHALSQLFVTLSRSRRLLVVIEDLHWADETTLDFLLYCIRHVTAAAEPPDINFLLTYRSEDAQASLIHALAELDRLRLPEEMHLDPLTRAETEVMVRSILDIKQPLKREFLDELFRLTDGNPFFTEEVLKSLYTSQGFGPTEAIDRDSLSALVVPRTIKDAVMRRRGDLSPNARRVLEMASVAGQRFDLTLLKSVLGMEWANLVDLVKELVAAQLVVEESAGRFRFRHALTREAVYSGLLSTERATHHAALAAALEAMATQSSNDQDGVVVDLAHHFYMAGDWPKAQRYCEQAGRRAQELFTPAACVEHLTHAIEAARQQGATQESSLLRTRAGAYEMLGEFSKALADLDASLATARNAHRAGEEWEALLAMGVLWLSRDYDRAGAFFRDALVLAEKSGDRLRVAHSLNRVGNWQMNIGDPPGALARHQEALAVFDELDDADGRASTLDLLGMTSYHCVQLADEMSYHRQAVELFRRVGNRQGAVSSLSLLAVSSASYDWPAPPASTEELSLSFAAGDEALADARAMGWPAGESFAAYTLGMTLGLAGDYRRAIPLAREGLRIAMEIDHEQWHVASLRGLGELHLDLNDAAGARALLEDALDLARTTKSDFWIVSASSGLARAMVALGEAAAAQDLLPPFDKEAPLVLTAWHAGGAHLDIALALQEFEEAIDLADRLERTVWPDGRPSRLSLKRAEALLGLNRLPEAAAVVERVLAVESMLPVTLLWRAHALDGRVQTALGRRSKATRAYRAARRIVTELAGRIDDEALQAIFLRGAEALLPQTRPETEARAQERERFDGLTEREREVASLIALGRSNRDIAETLFLSERTVAVHVANMLDKLAFQSRTQIAAWAVAKGLTASTSSPPV